MQSLGAFLAHIEVIMIVYADNATNTLIIEHALRVMNKVQRQFFLPIPLVTTF